MVSFSWWLISQRWTAFANPLTRLLIGAVKDVCAPCSLGRIETETNKAELTQGQIALFYCVIMEGDTILAVIPEQKTYRAVTGNGIYAVTVNAVKRFFI